MIRAYLTAASCTLLLTSACVNEAYDGVPVDLRYRSTIEAGFAFALAPEGTALEGTATDGSEQTPGDMVTVGAFGIAIGFTRVHECADTVETPWARFGQWLLPVAHAHSPSTPTSSGIPVILSTGTDAEDTVRAALRPVRGKQLCAVEIQLLNADDDAHMLEALPEILNTASTAEIDGTWLRSAAGTSRRFELATPLLIEDGLRFDIELPQASFTAEVATIQGVTTTQELSDALQDAAMRALTLEIVTATAL